VTEAVLETVAERIAAGQVQDLMAQLDPLLHQVFEHARVVFGTLSEAVSRKEWFDIVVELPEDHRPLMPAGVA
jgi:uncharacterized protein (DUF2267 family)